MLIERRNFLVGAAATLFCAPAIVRPASIMRVKPILGDFHFRWVVAEHVKMPGEAFVLGIPTREEYERFVAGKLPYVKPADVNSLPVGGFKLPVDTVWKVL